MFFCSILWRIFKTITTQTFHPSITVVTQAGTVWPCASSVQLRSEPADHLVSEQGWLRGIHLHGQQQDWRECRHYRATCLRLVTPFYFRFTAIKYQSTFWSYLHERESIFTCSIFNVQFKNICENHLFPRGLNTSQKSQMRHKNLE